MPEIFLLTGLARALTLLTPFRGLWVRSSRTSTTTEDPRVAALPRGLARVLALLVLVCCPACGSDGADPFDPGPDPNPETDLPIPPVTSGTWYRPPVTTTWQWQLQGDLNTEYEVALYELDLFETPASVISALKASGHRLLCYFSAGSWEDFRPDAGQFPSSTLGSVYSGFGDERWLDVRSPGVMTVMKARLDLAVERGCDGVEADNVDGFENPTGFSLTAADQLAFNRALYNEAHSRGLAVALKNDVGQVADLLAYVDLHVSERCHEFDECQLLDQFIAESKPVLNAEYLQQYVGDASARDAMCAAARARGLRTLVLPEDLDDSFRFSCDSN